MERLKSPEELMTEHAKRAEALKLALEAACAQTIARYRVEVTRPEQSTGGGVRALQRIRLLPADGAAVVVGEADTKEKRAELRTLGLVQTLSERRFGRDVPVSGEEYLRFLDKATRVLEEFGLKVTVSALPSQEAGHAPGGQKPAPKGAVPWVLAAVALCVGVVLAWHFLH